MTVRGGRKITETATAPLAAPRGTQCIQRTLEVLRVLAAARDVGLGLTEISLHAALPHPTAHRILRILVSEGIVEQKPRTLRYVIGEQIPLLALSRRTRDPVLDGVGPHLKAAVGDIGDAGFFTRRAGSDTVCVARHLGTYPIQVLAWDVGERRPLGISNAGVAILSGMPTEAVRGVVAKNRSRLSGYRTSQSAILREVALPYAHLRTFTMKEVCALTGISRTHIYRLEAKGEFPRRVKWGLNSIRFYVSEVEAWMAARPRAAIGFYLIDDKERMEACP